MTGVVSAYALFDLEAGTISLPQGAHDADLLDHFPKQPPKLVEECVGAAHGRFELVRNLVDEHPALAAASHDWGYGDWETPLGAAAHMGNREIAEFLLSKGARSNIFSAAMLGQLDVVRAFITASPGIQSTTGPHGITLLRHARAGGERAQEVVKYLESVGDADPALAVSPLPAGERERYLGTYAFGTGDTDRIEVSAAGNGIQLKRVGGSNKPVFHVGNHEFRPGGAHAVRIRFTADGAGATSLTVIDHDVVLTAQRIVP